MGLNAKQEAFAKEVVRNGGDKVAAFKLSWSWENMNTNTLSKEADVKYNHPKISPRIAELQKQKDEIARKEFQIDAEYVLRRLKQIDDLDILDIMEDDLSAFKKLSEWPKAWRTSISGVDVKRIVDGDAESVIEKIKWPDKVKNLDMIGRHVTVKAWDKEVDDSREDIIQRVQIEVVNAS